MPDMTKVIKRLEDYDFYRDLSGLQMVDLLHFLAELMSPEDDEDDG
jgi:hypothetical protein